MQQQLADGLRLVETPGCVDKARCCRLPGAMWSVRRVQLYFLLRRAWGLQLFLSVRPLAPAARRLCLPFGRGARWQDGVFTVALPVVQGNYQ